MIVLDRVSITLKERTRKVTPLDDVSISIPTDARVGLLGASKSGKTTLLRLLAGMSRPKSGRILTDATISFPAGAQVGIVPSHSLRRNIVTAAKIYRVDPTSLVQTVADAAGCRPFLDLPFAYVPTEIATKFRFAMTYALPFDTYLMDGTPMPFMQNAERMNDLLASRLSQSGFILAASNESTIGKYCDVIYIINDGKVVRAPDAKAAIVAFRTARMARGKVKIDAGELKTLIREARHLLQLHDIPAAENKAQEAYEKFPDELEVLLLLAETSRAAGNKAQANEMLKRACEQFGDREEPWLALQRFLSADGDPDRALPWGHKMIRQKNPKTQLAGARVIMSYGAPEDALQAWQSIAAQNPASTLGLSEVGTLQFKLGQFDEAIATADTELARDPGSWRAVLLKAKCLRALDRVDDLMEPLILLAQLKPEQSMPYVSVLRRYGREADADRLFGILQGVPR